MKAVNSDSISIIITPDDLLEQWQGHRALTRRVIEAFPDDKLFEYSIGGMRPFAEMTVELLQMTAPGAHGVATGNWDSFTDLHPDVEELSPKTKEEILELWDWTTEKLNELWSQIPEGRFQETDVAFGQYEGKTWWHIFYFIDNEIHHRGQGYVYLRSLDIEPPYFWERN